MNALFFLKSKATVAVIFDDNTLRRGLELMRESGYTAIPVITRDGDYAGSIREGDVLCDLYDHAGENTDSVKIRNVMKKGWNPAVTVDVTMDELLDRALNQNFVPVVDDRNKFIGIITRRDILEYYRSGEPVSATVVQE